MIALCGEVDLEEDSERNVYLIELITQKANVNILVNTLKAIF
jgi:hypothetical protein